jgi:hypothetical protein
MRDVPTTRKECLSAYERLRSDLDAFQARARQRHGAEITCASGCAGCCRTRIGVFPLEAEVVRREAAALPGHVREALRDRLLAEDAGGDRDTCPFLLQGACSIYPARPLVCRVHGLPARSRHFPPGAVDVCELNFTGVDADRIDPATVLPWDDVGDSLALLNFLFVEMVGREPRGRARIPLEELAREAAGLPVEAPGEPGA